MLLAEYTGSVVDYLLIDRKSKNDVNIIKVKRKIHTTQIGYLYLIK